MPSLRAAAHTDIGRVRRQNEDRFLRDDAALVYGVADYIGGHASRRLNSTVVTALGQLAGFAMLGVFLLILGDPVAPLHDWWWGLGAGAIGVIGIVSFYRALADGVIAVVRFSLTRLVRSDERQQLIQGLQQRWNSFRGQG